MKIDRENEPHSASSSDGSRGNPLKRRGELILVYFLPLVWLWFRLINNLWPEWNTNPQYSYGLVVPLLVAGLLVRRWQHCRRYPFVSTGSPPWLTLWLAGFLAFLFLPIRLITAATPEWRPVEWLFGFVVIGLTLYAAYLAGGKAWLRSAAFPVLFFLVAIPWPSPIEQPIIQGLSRMNASLVVEVMGILDVPAIPHGNIIEVSTGYVGINDACSGIRSFQSCLMISLFLGEYYMFSWRRRLLLLPIGFALALGFNLCRASLLTWIAAKKGVDAIAEYHDEAGFSIMLACTAVLWGVAWLMTRRKNRAEPAVPGPVADNIPASPDPRPRRCLKRFATVLALWLMFVESGVSLWYHFQEANLKPGPRWTVKLPVDDPTFEALSLTAEERQLLQFDEGENGRWQEADGTVWQVFYFDWKPGRVAGYLAKRHTPEICLTASGLKMTAGPTLDIINVQGVELPMRAYTFDSSSGPLQVFQCRWEAGMSKESYMTEDLTRLNLIRGIWAGRGNQGQKVLEVIISGYDDPEKARQALVRELDKLIKVEPAVKTE